jgi:hypothetical protein
MRFKQFLAEEYTYSLDQAVEAIVARCPEFLNKSAGIPLLRGMKQSDTAMFFEHPANRPPRDSEAWFNWMFNAMCELAFDVKDIRRNAMFATGNYEQAEEYGRVCFIFPAGNFEFIASDIINDSLNTGAISNRIVDQFKKDGLPVNSSLLHDVFKFLREEYPSPHDWIVSGDDAETRDAFLRAIKINNDDEIDAPFDASIEGHDVHEMLMRALSDSGMNLYDSTNLHRAIKDGNEIIFYKSKGYFAVPLDLVLKEMIDGGERGIGSLTNYSKAYNFLMDRIHGSSRGHKENQADS